MPDVRTFPLPDLGEGLEDAEIVEWLVAVGDTVQVNDELVEVETAKANVRIPSPFAGVVVEVFGAAGESLQVGTPLCRIDSGGDPPPDQPDTSTDGPAALDPAAPQLLVGYGNIADGPPRPRDRSSGTVGAADSRPRAKPPVRKLAKDLGVDLADINLGTGPNGSISRDDVRSAASLGSTGSTTSAPSTTRPRRLQPGFRGRTPGEVEAVRGIRKRIIEKMELSRTSIPHAGCSRDADLSELWDLRAVLNEEAADRDAAVTVTPLAVVCKATILGLRRFPTLNSRYDPGAAETRLLEHINLGIAVDTDRGLLVPNIKDADLLSTMELASEISRLAIACREGTVTPADLTGGTFTVDNYGYFGNDDGDMIINAPESGILGMGAVRDRPWVHDGEITIRKISRLTLAFDHRLCDGGEAGRFITYVASLVEEPARMLVHL
ncbi:MAG: 2-oxo acid dehydrogenase subunit E2 [Actinomycetota bacterium]|nr:2-oxo acid dehydrogenase subunit E2 [Actinomycetota bacterium]